MGIVVALLWLPIFLALALLLGLMFGLVGGGASALVAVWPLMLFYHDRFVLAVVPPHWRVGLIRQFGAHKPMWASIPIRPGRSKSLSAGADEVAAGLEIETIAPTRVEVSLPYKIHGRSDR
jgi:hypothetical protein